MFSSSVHSSISGHVTKISPHRHPNSSHDIISITIQSDGKDAPHRLIIAHYCQSYCRRFSAGNAAYITRRYCFRQENKATDIFKVRIGASDKVFLTYCGVTDNEISVKLDAPMMSIEITACSKGLLNGQCSGAKNSMCEVDKDMECGWERIYRCLEKLGQLPMTTGSIQVRNFAPEAESEGE